MCIKVRYDHVSSFLILSSQDNSPFPKEITQAKFYYVDKFVLLSCGNGLHLYKYHIDVRQKDDVKRLDQHLTIFVHTKCVVLVRLSPRPSRLIRFGDVTERRTLFRSDHVT